MARWPWIERNFTLDFPPGKFPDLLERVRGTPARVEDMVAGADQAMLTRQPDDGWTVRQNIGHLIDLEPLHMKRIDQILAGETILLAADMSNKKTNEAGHNERDIADLLTEFRHGRMEFVNKFEGVDEADWSRSALHPRTKLTMRIVDIAYFTAEHDDYHLARMRELIRRFT